MKRIILIILFLIHGTLYANFANPVIESLGSRTICEGDSVVLFLSNPQNGDNYQWQRNGNNIVGATNDTLVVRQSGSYRLIVNPGNNSDNSNTLNVTVNPKPFASFTFNPNSGCGRTKVTFTNNSNDGRTPPSTNNLTYQWDFGDGANSTNRNPSHTFNPPFGSGSTTYTIRLIVTNNSGCKDTAYGTLTLGNRPDATLNGPGATIINGEPYFKICAAVGQTFIFTNASSTIPINTLYTIKWGDGSPDYVSNLFDTAVSHDYSVGLKTLTFIVSSATCVDTTIYNVFVGNIPAGGIAGIGGSTICAGNSQQFVITNTINNPPGTIYELTYNDVPTTVSFVHPAPDTVSHIFPVSSCGSSSSSGIQVYPNSFGAYLTITNPCGTASGSIVPIYVSDKPLAGFTISKDSLCEGQNAIITSTATVGRNVENGVCTNGKFVWRISSITPGGSFSLLAGSLGNTFGLSNPNLWNAGTPSLNVQFNVKGTYKIVQITANNTLCGADSTVKYICVNAVPIANFSSSTISGCAPLNVDLTNLTDLPVCGTDSFHWAVTFTPIPGCLPGTGSFQFINGSGPAAINPSLSFSTPGIYRITLLAYAPGNSCVSAPKFIDIEVKDRPSLSMSVPAAICLSGSISPIGSAGCYVSAATYLWSFPGGTPASSNSFSPGPINYASIGEYTISLQAQNECGITNIQNPLSVRTVSPANAGLPQTKCGNTVTLSATIPNIGTGSWSVVSGPNTPIIVSPVSPTTVVNGLIIGTYTFRWTVQNNPCLSTSDVVVNIVSGPTAANAGPDQAGCKITTANLQGNIPVLGTGQWIQSGGSPATILNSNLANTSVSGLQPGVYRFRWVISFENCTPTADEIQITVYDDPSLSNAGLDQTICASVVNLSAQTPTIGSGRWYFINGPNTPVITNPLSASSTVTGLVTGSYQFRWEVTNGPCAASNDTVLITITGLPSIANAGPDQQGCELTSINLSGNTPSSGNGTWTFITGPNTPVITSPNLSNSQVTGLIPGVYTFRWTITNGVCLPSIDDVKITVYENTTIADAGSPQSLCGSIGSLVANSPIIGVGQWSIISGPNIPLISNINIHNPTVSGLIPGSYVFRWTITNGSCQSISDVSITVLNYPTPANAGSDQGLCDVSSTNLIGNNPVYGTGQWSLVSGPNIPVITTPATPTTTVTGLVSGVYIFRWTISNGICNPTTDDVKVEVSALPTPANAGSDQVLCSTVSNLNANNPLIGSGRWSLVSGPNVPTIIDPSSPTTSVSGLLSGTYVFRWTITNGFCNSLDQVSIEIEPLPTVANAGPDQLFCARTFTTLSGNQPLVGSGEWLFVSGPNTPIIQNPLLPVTQVSNLIIGEYIFRWSISNGTCAPSFDEIKVAVSGEATIAVAGPDQLLCGNISTMAANIALVGNGVWSQVSGPSLASITNNTDPYTTMTGLVPGNYIFRWTITNGSCISSSDVGIQVITGPTAALAGPDQQLCEQTSINLSGNVPLIGTGSWTQISGPTTVIINSPSTANTSVDGLIVGIYWFRYSISFGNCTTSNDDVQITIYERPSPADAGPDQTICTTTTSMNGVLPLIGNGLWSQLSGPNNAIIDQPINEKTLISGLIPGTYIFEWKVSNGVCTPNSDQVKIIVDPSPTISNAGPDQFVCSTGSIFLVANQPLIGQGIWTQQSGPTMASITNPSQFNTSVSGLVPGVYEFIWTITNGVCASSQDIVRITNYPSLQNSIDLAPQILCSGQEVFVNGNPVSGGSGSYQIQWQLSYDQVVWSDIAGQNQEDLNLLVTRNVYLRRKVTDLPCVNTSDFIFITVQPGISNNTLSGISAICINTIPPKIIGSEPSGGDGIYQYQWEISINNGNTWSVIPGAIERDYQPGILNSAVCYRRAVFTQLCSGPQSNYSDIYCIIIRPDAKASISYATDTACWPFLLPIQNTSPTGINGSYDWYIDNNYIGTSQNFPGYTLTNPSSVVTVKMVARSLYGCLPDSVEHSFVTLPRAEPFFSASAKDGCGPLSVTFSNLTPLKAQFRYRWNFGNGQQSTLDDPGTVIFQPNPTFLDTLYRVSLFAFNECDTIEYIDSILVRSKPKAIFSVDKTRGCSPMVIKFINGSRGLGMNYAWDFGDGTRINTNDPSTITHTYYTGVQQTFIAKLIVTNDCGIDSFKLNIVVVPNTIDLNVVVDGATLDGCVPHNVRIINNSRGGTIYRWNFGDGSTYVSSLSAEVINHTYQLSGNYRISVQALNSCSDTTGFANVVIYPKPKSDFNYTYLSNCIGDSIQFNNQTDTATSYLWNFGDGIISTSPNPKHSYLNSGVYSVLLISYLQQPSGVVCVDSIRRTISVVDRLPGIFSVSDSILRCDPLSVRFLNLSVPSMATNWDFGDGTFGQGDDIVHVFPRNGEYTVKMRAVDPGGCLYEYQKKIVGRKPEGQLNYSGGLVCDLQPVRFNLTTSYADSVKIDFGDGIIANATTSTVYHVYSTPGIYIPKIIMYSGANGACQITLKGNDSIYVDKLHSGFKFIKSQQCDKTLLAFTDTAFAFSGVSKYEWVFGDGQRSNDKAPIHQYSTSGLYNIQLNITSVWGCTDTFSIIEPVVVNTTPIAAFTMPVNICVNDSVAFQNSTVSADPVTYVFWKLNTGLTSNGNTFKTRFDTSGSYVLTLIVGTTFGCYDTITKNFEVRSLPALNVSPDVQICKGQVTSISASGSDNYIWLPGNGLSCTSCASPLAAPDFTTNYKVLTTNQFGCIKSDSVLVKVIQPFRISISPTDTLCIGESTQLQASGAHHYSWAPASGLSCLLCPAPIANPDQTTTYRVVGFDNENCFTDTGYIRIVVGDQLKVDLGPDQKLSTGTILPIQPIVLNGPIRTNYWSPSNDISCINCPSPTITVKKDACYILDAESIYGCKASDTLCISVFCSSSQVFIPNAFTPDGDGLNDILMVRGTGIKIVKKFIIFNRWGEVVFDKQNFNVNDSRFGWDGKIRGVKASPDVYVYLVEVACENDTIYSYKGNVTIIN